MRRNKRYVPVIIALVLCVCFVPLLLAFTQPLKDLSLDLSLVPNGEDADPAAFDSKGWTVYVQTGDQVKELTHAGLGSYQGLELGQTFYFSRVMEEELDDPTLQLSVSVNTVAVFLDDALIYTDCPELDNRIGYLTLPVRDVPREEPLNVSLPIDYRGKTLTIAQSMPDYTESSRVAALPCNVMLYCDFAYESTLVAESFTNAYGALIAFLASLVLLAFYIRTKQWSALCIAVVALMWMASMLLDSSFAGIYFDTMHYDFTGICRLLALLALLCFLSLEAPRWRGLLWGLTILSSVVTLACIALVLCMPVFPPDWIGYSMLPEWCISMTLLVMLLLGAARLRKESRFYRAFIPLALIFSVIACLYTIATDSRGLTHLLPSLRDGQITYLYVRFAPAVMIAAVASALVNAVQQEIRRYTEKRMMDQRHSLLAADYENIRRQHEEIMMLRHDTQRHYLTLRGMESQEARTAYLDELIGQNQRIRPVMDSGNTMLDLIIGSRLAAAADAGVKVEILQAHAPEKLRLSDADLCSLVMNLMDNAIAAAKDAAQASPVIRLNIHVKGEFFAFVCENTARKQAAERDETKETMPKHGLGLKIVQRIVERYEGVIDAEQNDDCYIVRVAIPLS